MVKIKKKKETGSFFFGESTAAKTQGNIIYRCYVRLFPNNKKYNVSIS